MTSIRRAVTLAAVTSLAVVPAAASAATHGSGGSANSNKAAVAKCKAERKQIGAVAFDNKYGKKDPLGKCVSAAATSKPKHKPKPPKPTKPTKPTKSKSDKDDTSTTPSPASGK